MCIMTVLATDLLILAVIPEVLAHRQVFVAHRHNTALVVNVTLVAPVAIIIIHTVVPIGDLLIHVAL